MRKVLVFQHVAHKILGTLNPTLKGHGLRMRYVNFERTPDAQPTLQKYNGLVVLGGHMGVYEAHKYTHIKVEMQLIEEALKKEIPILGICLGAQLLAHVLGSEVRKNHEKEIGWYDVELTEKGASDHLLSAFGPCEKVFQLHGDTFDIPRSSEHLAFSKGCPSQAFRYGDKVYGLQFHLEVDRSMIHRWLENPLNQRDILNSNGKFSLEKIREETEQHIAPFDGAQLQNLLAFYRTFFAQRTACPARFITPVFFLKKLRTPCDGCRETGQRGPGVPSDGWIKVS